MIDTASMLHAIGEPMLDDISDIDGITTEDLAEPQYDLPKAERDVHTANNPDENETVADAQHDNETNWTPF